MNAFALIGVGGYIAPRHMQAINDTGNEMVCSIDGNDSVGIIDRYFPHSRFFSEFEQFDYFLYQQKAIGKPINYVTICSPNYLHIFQAAYSLRYGANVICEKPLVLDPDEIEKLVVLEKANGCNVSTILQLRLHPSLVELKRKIDSGNKLRKYDVELTYITSRGDWYMQSWKSNQEKSGGIATNIGVHFFDLLGFLFGPLKENTVHFKNKMKNAGYLEFENARVRWFLSLDLNDIPERYRKQGRRTFREITIDGDGVEFSGGFDQLHTLSYKEILKGRGFGIEDNRLAIEIVSDIRHAAVNRHQDMYHPLLKGI